MRAVVATGAVVAVLLPGCGGTDGGPRSERLVRGQKIFASECSGCHTLVGRESGAVGGDLVLVQLKQKDLASFARVMPTAHPLSPAAAAAVASYISSRACRRARRSNGLRARRPRARRGRPRRAC